MTDNFPIRELPSSMTVHVWQIQLDDFLKTDRDLDRILSIDERERAERFVFAKDAHRFRYCRAMLRLGLAWYLRVPVEKIDLTMNRHGKPCLREFAGIYFNVTHSAGLAAIAFTAVGEVGIDIEALRTDVDAMEIASANFTSKEASLITKARSKQEQVEIFLRIWTRKEAVLKAAGRGILHGLNTVDVSGHAVSEVKLAGSCGDNADSCWRVHDLNSMKDCAGAVAAPVGDWSIKQWPAGLEDVFSLSC
jgi:4'-phosphopantetheinyl transferase